MIEPGQPFGHFDNVHEFGYHASVQEEDGDARVVINLIYPPDELDGDVGVFHFDPVPTDKKFLPNGDAHIAVVERDLLLARAACTFLNAGGDPSVLYGLSRLEQCSSMYPLFQVLASANHTVDWRFPDGQNVLRVCYDDDGGFSEVLPLAIVEEDDDPGAETTAV